MHEILILDRRQWPGYIRSPSWSAAVQRVMHYNGAGLLGLVISVCFYTCSFMWHYRSYDVFAQEVLVLLGYR